MNDITPEQTLNRRLVHGKISRALCLEAKDRIEELEEGVAEWHLKAYREGKRIKELEADKYSLIRARNDLARIVRLREKELTNMSHLLAELAGFKGVIG